MWDTSGASTGDPTTSCRQRNNAWLGTEFITSNFSWGRSDCFAARHHDQVNMAFGDGHVKALRCANVFPCGNKGFNTSNVFDTLAQNGSNGVGRCWNRFPDKPAYTANNGRPVPVDTCP
jgi:prepilin-type processing-associated H-X9-DG protein